MSSFAQAIVDKLNADATLLTTLTGKAHNFSDGGKNGLSRIQIPGTFDPTTGLIKPVCLVAEFPEVADNQIVDTQTGYHSTVTQIVMRIWDNGNKSYDDINTCFNRIYSLLAYQQVPGAFQILFRRVLRDRRDPLLKDAAYYEAYFDVFGSLNF